jgi:hypothetical protein
MIGGYMQGKACSVCHKVQKVSAGACWCVAPGTHETHCAKCGAVMRVSEQELRLFCEEGSPPPRLVARASGFMFGS